MTVCECAHVEFQASFVVQWCWRNQRAAAMAAPSPRSCASPLFHRYGDDAQLREITGYKPVAVVRLQQQWEQQAGVPKICRAFHQQPMPPSVHTLIFMHVVFYSTFSSSSCVSLVKWYQALLKRWFKTKMNSWVCVDSCVPINIFLISGNAIQAFGNGTDVGVWQPQPPIEPTAVEPSITGRNKDQTSNALDALTDLSKLDLNGDSLYHVCGTSQVKLRKSFSVLGVCVYLSGSFINQCCPDSS